MVDLIPPPESTAPQVPGDDADKRRNRPRYRPPLGVPTGKGRELGGKIASILIHALIIFLVFVPLTNPEIIDQILGAGGPGPAGGGGGGRRGTGGVQERSQYVKVTPPPPPPPKPTIVPQIKPPEIKPPVVPPPVQQPPTPPAPVKTDEKPAESKNTEATAPVSGTGGGTGNDGTNGSGPGKGGGQGSGEGTGRGSSVGPGTGGGPGTIYPPTPTELFVPPLPVPKRVSGREIVATFDVDSTGKVVNFEFTQTPDGGYNGKLRQVLAQIKFRPAVNGLGMPVRFKYQMFYTF